MLAFKGWNADSLHSYHNPYYSASYGVQVLVVVLALLEVGLT